MKIRKWADFLREIGGNIGPARESGPVSACADVLPAEHLELLRLVNGVTAYHGAFRLFGLNRTEPAMDLVTWNSRSTWRFSWDDRREPFLMFGETAWGDQYAYKRKEGGILDGEVYFLEGVLLHPEIISGSFEEFMENELARNSREPYDQVTVQVVNRGGEISANQHWVHVPSVALGGPELPENVVQLPAVTAMIFAGDIASALKASRPDTLPIGVTPWTDEHGRSRLAVEFA